MDPQHTKSSHAQAPVQPGDAAYQRAASTAGKAHPADIQRALAALDEFTELVPDASERARLLSLPEHVEAAWHEGRMLPVLRAHARRITQATENQRRAT